MCYDPSRRMQIVSINLQKRLFSRGDPVQRWLDGLACDLLAVQEPWGRARVQPVRLQGYRLVGGNSSICCWLASRYQLPCRARLKDSWECVDCQYFSLYNVYLPEKSKTARADILRDLRCDVIKRGNHPVIIVGDFNLAPEPEDGLYGDRISKWTGKAERTALKELLSEAHLIDMTSMERVGRREFTFERVRNGLKSAFRCDLALVSESVASFTAVRYDHRVRVPPMAFTDHSSTIVEIPVGHLHERKPLGSLKPIVAAGKHARC